MASGDNCCGGSQVIAKEQRKKRKYKGNSKGTEKDERKNIKGCLREKPK